MLDSPPCHAALLAGTNRGILRPSHPNNGLPEHAKSKLITLLANRADDGGSRVYLHGVPMGRITWDLLERCRADRVRESRTLDFKQRGPDLYADSREARESKRSFLEDVCAFANANGGLLLLGVTEDRIEGEKQNVIGDLAGVDLPGGVEDYRTRIEDMVRTSFEPRFAGVKVKGVDSGDGRTVVAVGVDPSVQAPHRVNAHGSREFMTRMMTASVKMDADEIRRAAHRSFQLLRDAEARVELARERAIESVRPRYGGISTLWFGFVPLHAGALPIPISHSALAAAIRNMDDTHPQMGGLSGVRYDYLGAHIAYVSDDSPEGFPVDRVLRDGSVERWDFVGRNDTRIAEIGLADALDRGVTTIRRLRDEIGVTGPALVLVGLFDSDGLIIEQVFRPARGGRMPTLSRRPLPDGPLFSPTEESSDEFLGPTLKKVADFFWQSSGHRFCAGFDDLGNRVPGLE